MPMDGIELGRGFRRPVSPRSWEARWRTAGPTGLRAMAPAMARGHLPEAGPPWRASPRYGNNRHVWSFAQFARPKTMTAEFSDGSSTTLHLADAPTLQRFPVDVTTDSVKLTIRTVYHGTDYPAACISEVEFGGRRRRLRGVSGVA